MHSFQLELSAGHPVTAVAALARVEGCLLLCLLVKNCSKPHDAAEPSLIALKPVKPRRTARSQRSQRSQRSLRSSPRVPSFQPAQPGIRHPCKDEGENHPQLPTHVANLPRNDTDVPCLIHP